MKKSRFGGCAKNLHELVNEYVRTWETLQSFAGHFLKGNDFDLKFCINFSNLVDKFDKLYYQIILQYKKEDPSVAIHELKRAIHLGLDEGSVMKLVRKELENDE